MEVLRLRLVPTPPAKELISALPQLEVFYISWA